MNQQRQKENSGAPDSATDVPRLAFLLKSISGVLLVATVIYLVGRYFSYAHAWVATDNAYVAGHIHSVGSRVAGTVQEVLVDENQSVRAGDVLARLDTAEYEVRRNQAQAQFARAGAEVKESQARIAQGEAEVAREQARATKATNDLARARALFEGGAGAISRQELELAIAEFDSAQAALKGARSAMDSAIASTSAALAQEKAASASLQDAELQLGYTQIVAPSAGRIGKKNLEIGNRVQVGQALFAVVEPNVWITANFKETQLARLRSGQRVRIKADAFPGQAFRGILDSLSPASGAQFALLPPDNATGNFTKIAQRVPVKIVLEPSSLGEFTGRLVAGMSVTVDVKVDN